MTTYFSSGGVLQGDLPGEEATRGGSREWTAETSDAVLATYERTSLAMSDRPDDFAALKEEALRQLKQKHRRRTAVLPGPVRILLICMELFTSFLFCTRRLVGRIFGGNHASCRYGALHRVLVTLTIINA